MYSLPAALTYDWATYCGIPGGIPVRETIYQTMTTANTATEINAAIAACPSGQVVYLAAGTYNIGQITFASTSGVTLRGAGAGQTIITPTTSPAITNTERVFFNEDHIDIASGSWLTKGSTSITLASAPSAAFSVGNLIMITQDDSPDVWGDGVGVYARVGGNDPWPLGATRNLRFATRITGVTGNVISLASPLPVTYSYSLNPYAMPLRYGPTTSLCGVEDLTIDGGGTIDRAVEWYGSDRCWVKGVEVKNAVGVTGMVFFSYSSQCEVNRCFFRDAVGYPTQSDGYGVMLYYGASGTLVVDNIFRRTGQSIIMNGAACNALVYNYSQTVARGATWVTEGINCNHGPHGVMNLFEGNIIPRFVNDGYHGSTSHGVLFRNHIHGTDPDGKTYERRIVDLCKGSYLHSVVGNVLGDSSWNPLAYEATAGFGHDETQGNIYVLGFPNSGNSSLEPETLFVDYDSGYPDPGVASTLLRHGNYDYYNDAIQYGDADHDIADSLFYSSKPEFFGGLEWPAIDPFTPTANSVPAKWRWDKYAGSGTFSDLFLDSPGVGEVSFTLSIVPVSQTKSQGAVASFVCTVNASEEFTDDVTLGVSGLPAGVTPSFSVNPVGPDGSSTLTIDTTLMDVATHSLTLTGEIAE